MSVAVIIPTFGRADLLRDLVAQLRSQTVPPASILFVDDSPQEDVAVLASELQVDYARNPGRPSLTRSRNLGIELTTQPVIAFLDSDVQLPANYLEEMTALLNHEEKPTAVQGWVPNPWNHGGWKTIPLALLGQGISAGPRMRFKLPMRQSFPSFPLGVSQSEWLSGSNMVFHRERLGDIRFDPVLERYCLAEDLEISLQLAAAGKVMLLSADVVVKELNDATGRIVTRDLELMRVINFRYILAKHFPNRRWKLRLAYQDFGWILHNNFWTFPLAIWRYWKHRRQLRANPKPELWNPLYRFWN